MKCNLRGLKMGRWLLLRNNIAAVHSLLLLLLLGVVKILLLGHGARISSGGTNLLLSLVREWGIPRMLLMHDASYSWRSLVSPTSSSTATAPSAAATSRTNSTVIQIASIVP